MIQDDENLHTFSLVETKPSSDDDGERIIQFKGVATTNLVSKYTDPYIYIYSVLLFVLWDIQFSLT